MEKVWNSDDLLPKKFKSIMKITLLFLILGILHVSADTYAQKAQVTVEVKSGTFYDVVSEIEKQTEFMFFYKSEDIDNSKQVDIQVKNRQVTDVLNELLKNTNLTYRISGMPSGSGTIPEIFFFCCCTASFFKIVMCLPDIR